MNGQAAGGAMLLLIALALAYLWINGYLSTWITAAAGAVSSPPPKGIGSLSRLIAGGSGGGSTGGQRPIPV